MRPAALISTIALVIVNVSNCCFAQSQLEKARMRVGDLRFSSYATSRHVEQLATDEAVRARAWETIQRMGITKLYIEVYRGGHVVLPLLEETVVAPGWISAEEFLAGYGAAQAVPGPLFSVAAYLGGIGMERGERDLRGIVDRRVGTPPDLALVRRREVEDREERLALVRAVAEVRLVVALVPGRHGRGELIVGLGAVGAVVTGGPQVLGEGLDVGRRHGRVGRGQILGLMRGPHVVRPDTGWIHRRDDARAVRRADWRHGIDVVEPHALRRQPIEVRRARDRVSVAAQMRADILARNPHDVRAASRITGRGPRRSAPGQQTGTCNGGTEAKKLTARETVLKSHLLFPLQQNHQLHLLQKNQSHKCNHLLHHG